MYPITDLRGKVSRFDKYGCIGTRKPCPIIPPSPSRSASPRQMTCADLPCFPVRRRPSVHSAIYFIHPSSLILSYTCPSPASRNVHVVPNPGAHPTSPLQSKHHPCGSSWSPLSPIGVFLWLLHHIIVFPFPKMLRRFCLNTCPAVDYNGLIFCSDDFTDVPLVSQTGLWASARQWHCFSAFSFYPGRKVS